MATALPSQPEEVASQDCSNIIRKFTELLILILGCSLAPASPGLQTTSVFESRGVSRWRSFRLSMFVPPGPNMRRDLGLKTAKPTH